MDGSVVRVLPALAEDPGSVPSTHLQLWGVLGLWPRWAPASVLIHRLSHTYISKRKMAV